MYSKHGVHAALSRGSVRNFSSSRSSGSPISAARASARFDVSVTPPRVTQRSPAGYVREPSSFGSTTCSSDQSVPLAPRSLMFQNFWNGRAITSSRLSSTTSPRSSDRGHANWSSSSWFTYA